MKIINHYDLTQQIKIANEGMTIKNALKIYVPVGCITFPLTTIIGLLEFNYYKSLAQGVLIASATMGIATLGTLIIDMINKIQECPSFQDTAVKELKDLAKKFREQNIITDYEMLMAGEQFCHTDYKIVFNKKKRPVIKQKKYILIKTYNEGFPKDISILQEHELFSRKYTLSHDEAVQKKVLKPPLSDT